MADPSKPRLSDAVAALRYRDFRRFFWSALASNSGAWLQAVAGPFIIFEITGSPTWLGIAAFSQMVPMALMAPIAGPLADRVPRRRILMITQVLMAVVSAAWGVLWISEVREVPAYIALSFVGGAINGFNMPAWQAFVSDLVPREALMNAITLNSTQFNGARLFGPALGGILLGTAGPAWCFFLNSASYGIVVFVLGTLEDRWPEQRGEPESPLRAFRSAGRYVRQRRGLVAPYVAVSILGFLGGTLPTVHLLVFADEVFKVDETRYGLLIAAFGVGAVVSAPWVASVGPRLPRSRLMMGGLITYGVGELVLAATANYYIGVVGVMIAGSAHITTATATNSTLQIKTTDEMRGRVMAMYLMVLTLIMPIGGLIQGSLLEFVSPRALMTAMGLMFFVGAAAIWFTGLVHHVDSDHEVART